MFRTIKSLPPIILFKRAFVHPIIKADVKRWVEILKPDRFAKPVTVNFVWLLQAQPAFRNLFYYRIGQYSSLLGKTMLWLAKLLYPPMETLGFAMPKIGPGFFIEYGFVTIIGAESIGENCWVNAGVTIGYRNQSGIPVIGNNVYVGAGAKVLGPIHVGDNVIIGANAVVLRDVPANCTVAGVPARIIKRDGVRVRESLSARKAS